MFMLSCQYNNRARMHFDFSDAPCKLLEQCAKTTTSSNVTCTHLTDLEWMQQLFDEQVMNSVTVDIISGKEEKRRSFFCEEGLFMNNR